MRPWNCSLISLLVFLLITTPLFMGLPLAGAQSEDMSPEALSIVMVIDVSGSMSRTDPHRLREAASRIFIDLLSPDDYLGIITFDHDVEEIFPLQQIATPAAKENYKETLAGKLDPRGYTDFNGALKAAYDQFQRVDTEGTRPLVLFLTDGEPNPSDQVSADPVLMTEYMEDLWEIVDDYSRERIPIYSVAFSDEIDPVVMERISTDTRGDYYILDNPVGLAESFFEMLGTLKNRKGFLQETFNLQEGPETVTFEVTEYTRQSNLVFLNPDRGEFNLTLTPPKGELRDIEGVKIDQRDDYALVILDQLEEDYWGQWEARISGSARVRALGDIDSYIKAWLEEPVPSSQHPLNEPLDFRVRVTRGEHMKDLPLKAEVQLTRAGQDRVTIPLEEEGEYFTGSYAQVDRTGTYEILVRVLLEDQVVSTYSSEIYVKTLPTISTDFWVEEGYRIGEEVIVNASLLMGGNRLVEGSDLQLDHFNLNIDYEDGPRTTMPLYDSGDTEHGNVRASDGIWSNRLYFEEEGTARAVFEAQGYYKGSDFLLEKNLGSFEVHPPGTVLISLTRDDLWTRPGRSLSIPLEIKNDSPFRETLVAGEESGLGEFDRSRIVLEPGERKTLDLNFNLASELETGEHTISVTFTPENELTGVEPSRLEVQVDVLTAGQAFARRYQGFLITAFIVLAVLLAIGFIFYAGGLFLYRTKVFPHTKVKGELIYWNTERDDSLEGETSSLELGKAGKDSVVISFNPDNQEADFHIKGSEFTHDLIIKTLWNSPYPKFVQGWKAVMHKQIPLLTTVFCTQPGIIESEGEIYTQMDLLHEDEFESGGYYFQYINSYGRWSKELGEGVNLLDGRM